MLSPGFLGKQQEGQIRFGEWFFYSMLFGNSGTHQRPILSNSDDASLLILPPAFLIDSNIARASSSLF